jgi:hypothetical protein
MANVLSPLKKFMKMNIEKKAGLLCLIGLFGIILMIIVDNCKILPWQIAEDLISAVFIASFGIGCFMMCYAYRNNTEAGAIPMIWGAFGLFGSQCAFAIIDWVTVKLFGFTILPIIPWIAIPCIILVFYGLCRIIIQGIKEAWERA